MKIFFGSDFLSNRDAPWLKPSLYLSRQDASEYVSGDSEKSILKFDPRSGLLPLTRYVQILRPYRKYVEYKFKKCFPLTGAYGIIIQRAPMQNQKSVFNAPPPNG